MTANLRAVLTQHAAWYESNIGPIQPEWFVFPSRNRFGPFDPTTPVGSLMAPWYTALKQAKVKCRPHDLPHTFCTKMAEAGVPEGTMLDMMGHMSTAMLRRYSHVRAQARREAMDAVEARYNQKRVAKVSAKVDSSEDEQKPVTH